MGKPSMLMMVGLAAMLAGAATDVLDKFQIRRDWAEQRMLDFTLRGDLPSAPAPLKNLGQQKASREVRPLGEVAKAIFNSPAFKESYAQRRKELLPPAAAVAKPAPELMAQQKKQREEQVAGLDKAKDSLAQMPPEQRKQFEGFLEMQRKQLASTPIDEAQIVRYEQLRVAQDKERYDRAMAQVPPAEPRVALRASLTKALADTDPGAPDSRLSGMCKRAGAACEQGRAFARDWLKELK